MGVKSRDDEKAPTLASRWQQAADGMSDLEKDTAAALKAMFYTGAYATYLMMLEFPRRDDGVKCMDDLAKEFRDFIVECIGKAKEASQQ